MLGGCGEKLINYSFKVFDLSNRWLLVPLIEMETTLKKQFGDATGLRSHFD